jgi:glycosyltransferase involved in cell wall biosynthesis
VIGRAVATEVDVRVASGLADRSVPRRRPRRPTVHLDPMSVIYHRLGARDVVLCHDMGPLTDPDLFAPGVSRLYATAYEDIRAAQPIMVFVSGASRAAFRRHYGDGSGDHRVIYNIVRAEMAEGPRKAVQDVRPPFLLTVGNVGARKNQRRTIEAFNRSGLVRHGVQYVVCGGREPGCEAVDALAAQSPGVVRLAYVSDAELRWLFGNATGFVLTSLLEGFGVPVAEAASAGVVPVVSRDSVLQEVAGEGGLFVDPLCIEETAAAMAHVVEMAEDERAARVAMLQRDLERFEGDKFDAAWRGVVETATA